MIRSQMRFPGFKRKAVTLSYDDGVAQDKRLVQIMQKNGLKGTFNINSGLLPKESGWHMTAAEALELYTNSGMEVAVHGQYHLSLANVDSAVATNDVLQDRLALENLFGCLVKGMAYANGSYNDEVVGILKTCGIEYARTVTSTEDFELPEDWLRLNPTCHHKNRKLMELVKAFLEVQPDPLRLQKYTPKLFYLWGHSYEFDGDGNWDVIEEFAEAIGNREDIWYATNGEIYAYVKAFDSLRWSADGKLVHNPSGTDVCIFCNKKEYLVKSGTTIKID
ncbi:MAG: polysaccharide deacetylase family protein [Clostridia bacterium]|nr:polysaccharide deacetylase family protein [Clostridia bacterium]